MDTNIKSSVINNDTSPDFFFWVVVLDSGTCSLPPFSFQQLKLLAIGLRLNYDIKEIVIDHEETNFLQYTNDTTAVLSDKESACKLFEL